MTTQRLTAPQARGRSRHGAWTLVGLALAALGCDEPPPNPARPRLLTFADFEALAGSGDPEATFATGEGVPDGLRVKDFVTSDMAGYHLPLRTTWTEGYRSAYETAEIWTGFDEIWVQPAYVPITGF